MHEQWLEWPVTRNDVLGRRRNAGAAATFPLTRQRPTPDNSRGTAPWTRASRHERCVARRLWLAPGLSPVRAGTESAPRYAGCTPDRPLRTAPASIAPPAEACATGPKRR